jgi:uncharacterized membrane protein
VPDAERLRRFIPDRAHSRLLVALALGLAALLASWGEAASVRALLGWNAFAVTLLAFSWLAIWTSDAAETHRRAAVDDPGRRLVWVVATLASAISLFAAVVVLRQAHRLAPDRAVLWVALCLFAVATAWLLTHTVWALHYAHLYYRDDHEGVGGLDFPGKRPPDAFDFAYFSFTMGICFQTSDVSIVGRQLRRSALFHAVLSFAYNTAIIALALNVAFGFLS